MMSRSLAGKQFNIEYYLSEIECVLGVQIERLGRWTVPTATQSLKGIRDHILPLLRAELGMSKPYYIDDDVVMP